MENGHSDHILKSKKKWLLVVNSVLLAIGGVPGPLLQRLYFLRGGKRIWVSSWLESAGFPFVLLLLLVSYLRRRSSLECNHTPFFLMDLKTAVASLCIGFLIGLTDYMYSVGLSFLPVSTSSLLSSSHLAFTALFAYFVVKQQFSAYSINSVMLLTLGSAVLGLQASKDRPTNVSSGLYLTGYLLTLGASLLYGFILPLFELVCSKAKQNMSYTLAMEMQLVITLAATGFCTVGMLVNGDFQEISKEARIYELGEAKYYMVLIWTAVAWQLYFIGTVGVIFSSSSLFSGVLMSLLLPVTELMAVMFFKESFGGEKGISLILSIWGFISYLYGERKSVKEVETNNFPLHADQC